MMNMAIRGIEAHIEWNEQGSFQNDAFKDLKADYLLANPPFVAAPQERCPRNGKEDARAGAAQFLPLH